MLVVVGVVGVAAVVADFVCAAAVAVWVWEASGSGFACETVGVLLLVLAVALSARLEAVWLRLLATLAVPPEPHAAKVSPERLSTHTRKAQRLPAMRTSFGSRLSFFDCPPDYSGLTELHR